MLTRDQMERRRLAAATLFRAGLRASAVAATLGVSRTTGSRWKHLLVDEGEPGLKRHVPPGRPTKVDSEKLEAKLRLLCEKGPRASGYARNRWSTTLLAEAIRKEFRVRYHPDHLGRLLHRLGIEWRPTRLKN